MQKAGKTAEVLPAFLFTRWFLKEKFFYPGNRSNKRRVFQVDAAYQIMKFSNKLTAYLLGLTVLMGPGCGNDKDRQNDPVPIDSSGQKTCQLTEESMAVKATYTYNSNGQVDQMKGHPDYYSKFFYNAAGNIIEHKRYDASHTLVSIETISYNSSNLPESRFFGPLPNQNGNRYYYNAANQLVKQTIHLTDTVAVGVTIYSYPAPGQVVSQDYSRDANGQQVLHYTKYTYYDNMKSPNILLGYLREGILVSKHNVTKIVLTNHLDNTIVTTKFDYDYNSEGFPLTQYDVTGGQRRNYNNWRYNCL